MCGLVGTFGAYLSTVDQDFFKDGLVVSQLRGQDSTGISAVYGKSYNVTTLKGAMDSSAFLARDDVSELFRKLNNTKVLLGHTRYATYGTIEDKNAHPFRHEHILLAHNGGVYNKDELPDGKKFQVDSEAICHSIAKIGALETLRKVNGAFALSYYDFKEGRFNLIRNEGRPLFIVKHKNKKAWYYASEDAMLFWLLRRNDIAHEPIELVPESTLYSFDVDSEDLEITKVDYKKKADNWFNNRRSLPSQSYNGGHCNVSPIREMGLLARREIHEGPRGRGFSYLGSWGLAIGDIVHIHLASHERIARNAENCKGLAYFGGNAMSEADVYVHGFTNDQYEAIKNTHGRYFSRVVGCHWDMSEGCYVVNLSGLYVSPPNNGRVVIPTDVKGVYKPHPQSEVKEEKKEDFVLSQENLQKMADAIAEDHKALELSFQDLESPEFTRIPGDDECGDEPKPDMLVDGPRGGKMLYSRWMEVTKAGCGYCTLPLCSPDTTVWVGEAPVHDDCLKRMDDNY